MTQKLLRKIEGWIKDGKLYRCYQLKEWRGVEGIRQRAIDRDKYCYDCSSVGKLSRIDEVHHVVELKDNPSLFLRLDNVVCLCKACHNKRHYRFEGAESKSFKTEERW